VPMRWRRNTRSGASCHTMAHPDYGDAGIYREGHRASLEGQAPPGRDICPRSSERLICRCRGQIGPESDGRLRRAHNRIRQAGHPGLAGDGPAMPSAQRLTNEHLYETTPRSARGSARWAEIPWQINPTDMAADGSAHRGLPSRQERHLIALQAPERHAASPRPKPYYRISSASGRNRPAW
jgi:hypothetical protein